MTHPARLLGALATLALASLAFATGAQAQVVITLPAIAAGGITPGDAPGFPATLSASGSYVLDGNLTPPGLTPAIEITGNNVSLDLNGYVIDAGNRCTPTTSGSTSNGNTCSATVPDNYALIESSGARPRIFNGTVMGGTGGGISLYSSSPSDIYSGNELRNLRIFHNRGNGLDDGVYGAHIRNVHAYLNGAKGIFAQGNAVISDTKASRNGSTGIDIPSSSAGQRIVTTNNGGGGFEANGSYSLVEASLNGATGIVGALIANSRAGDNVQNGVLASPLVYELTLTGNAQRAYVGTNGCYARLYVRTTSAVTPQVQGGTPLNGSVTNCF